MRRLRGEQPPPAPPLRGLPVDVPVLPSAEYQAQVQRAVQEALREILRAQPDDPIDFLSGFFAERAADAILAAGRR